MDKHEDGFYMSGARELKFTWCVLFFAFVVHIFLMPLSVVEHNFVREVDHIRLVYGDTPFTALDQLGFDKKAITAMHGGLLSETRDFLKLEENKVRLFTKVDDYVLTRIRVVTLSIWILLIRTMVSAEALLLFTPALLVSVWIGIQARQDRLLTFSFTSPFLLDLSTGVLKWFAALSTLALFLPWYVHPEILPLLIGLCCLFSGVIFARLQKNL